MVIARAPGPADVFGLRNVYRFASDPLRFLEQTTRRYGDFVQLKLLGRPWYFLNHPDDIEEVLVKHARIMLRDEYVEVMKRTLGLGLLTSEGELWKRQRKLMAQAFTPKRIRSYADTMVAVTEQAMPWDGGEEINLHEEMSRMTLEVVAAVLFGASVGPREVRVVSESMEAVNEFYANSPEAIFRVPPWVPTPQNRRLDAAVARLDELIYAIIEGRRRGDDRDDILGTLLRARDDEAGQGPAAMSDQQLRDEAITLFLAGHETTALALTHTLYALSRNPSVAAKLEEELDEVLNGRVPSAEDTPRLDYTTRVLKESMRLYPPAWMIGRTAAASFELRGVQIPEGAQIMMSQWVMHRHPRWFPDPMRFDPDRWLPDRAAALPRFAYFPFGGGPRVCIGNHFAMMESTLMLAMLAQRYRFALCPGERLEFKPSITLRPKGPGLKVRVSARAAAGVVA